MKLNAFLQYARPELRIIQHPYTDQSERIEDIDLCVWIIDSIIRLGGGQHEALAENFYQALSDYLNTPRHQRAILRGSIDRLAVQFEGFLRTTVEAVIPEHNVVLQDKNGQSRGKLSQSGYLPDFLKHLCGINVKLGESKRSYWNDKSVEETIYGVCFRHQQRAKHEARDYSLAKLESLANQILSAYIFFARWLSHNSDIEYQVRERQSFARKELPGRKPCSIGQKFSNINWKLCTLILIIQTCKSCGINLKAVCLR